MVLWIFMVLTVLVGEFSRGMRDDAIASQNLAEEIQARGVAMAGMNQGIYRTLRAREQRTEDATSTTDQWTPDGGWHDGTYGGGRYSVRILDEGGKIPLNRADETLLRQVFANLGLDQDAQEALVDAILDWRDPDSLRRLHGAEADYYGGLPEPYAPKNGPFDSVDELLLVRGVSRELFVGIPEGGLRREEKPSIPLKEIFSVFNRTGNINVRNAPPAVLRVLLGGAEKDDVDEEVEEVIAARTADPGSALTLMRAKVGDPLGRRLVDAGARTIAIDAKAVMEAGQVQARVGAVVDVGEESEGFHVVRWFDRLPAL
ncbi:MAG: general secretion pathway protein GspK [Candidatus Binatia bacterium]